MRIRIAFTLDVPASQLSALKGFTQAEDPADVRDFLRQEAKDHLWEYLDANGITGVGFKMEGGEMTWP